MMGTIEMQTFAVLLLDISTHNNQYEHPELALVRQFLQNLFDAQSFQTRERIILNMMKLWNWLHSDITPLENI